MNRLFKIILLIFAGILLGASATFLIMRPKTDGSPNKVYALQTASVSDQSNDELVSLALEVAGYIKTKNFESLSKTVHPEYGVLFSPSSTVHLATNKCFTSSEVAKFGEDSVVYIWGVINAESEPINMTVSDYMNAYVYDIDYVTAPIIGVNYIVKSGDALENLKDVFPSAQFVDLHFPGKATSECTDWSTLRLVFETYKDELMLTAVIHSEWTI